MTEHTPATPPAPEPDKAPIAPMRRTSPITRAALLAYLPGPVAADLP
jgi:hypothetical protein